MAVMTQTAGRLAVVALVATVLVSSCARTATTAAPPAPAGTTPYVSLSDTGHRPAASVAAKGAAAKVAAAKAAAAKAASAKAASAKAAPVRRDANGFALGGPPAPTAPANYEHPSQSDCLRFRDQLRAWSDYQNLHRPRGAISNLPSSGEIQYLYAMCGLDY
jgi:hypothetical protein